MTDYYRLRYRAVYSKASDYSDPETDMDHSDTLTPDEYYHRELLVQFGSAITLDLTNFTTIHEVIVRNLDTTNYVTVEWTDVANANDQTVGVGRSLIFDGTNLDVSAGLKFTADTADCECEVLIVGT